MARRRLKEDITLGERTMLQADQIATLSVLFLLPLLLFFNKQIRGAAMGSPTSAVVANLYMKEFESEAIEV